MRGSIVSCSYDETQLVQPPSPVSPGAVGREGTVTFCPQHPHTPSPSPSPPCTIPDSLPSRKTISKFPFTDFVHPSPSFPSVHLLGSGDRLPSEASPWSPSQGLGLHHLPGLLSLPPGAPHTLPTVSQLHPPGCPADSHPRPHKSSYFSHVSTPSPDPIL